MKAAVLGSPVGHSLSPVLHRAAYDALGLSDWSYSLVECSSQELAAFIAGLDADWAGLSLTMPLKRTVLPLLHHVDPVAAATGGANTVVFRDDGRYGYNTDVQGIVDALAEAGAPVPGSVTILGGGATACSALAAAREYGAGLANVIVRDQSRTGDLQDAAARLGLRVQLRDAAYLASGAPSDLLISTVPAGVADSYAARIRQAAAAPAAVMDVVYHPWPTPLALAATAAGSSRGQRLRDAAAPGGRPGGTDDGQARPAGGDARGRRGRAGPPGGGGRVTRAEQPRSRARPGRRCGRRLAPAGRRSRP